METHYTVGRIIAGVCIGLGYAAGAIALVAGVIGLKSGGIVIIFWAVLGSVLNHGFWQMVLALFDLADSNRELVNLQRDANAAAKRSPPTVPQVAPRPASPSMPPTTRVAQDSAPTPLEVPRGMLPGETDAQWARRIEREDAEAFKRRSASR